MHIVKYLIHKFGDRKFELDDKGYSCLHRAALEEHMKVLNYLIEECGFDPSLGDQVEWQVLYLHCILSEFLLIHFSEGSKLSVVGVFQRETENTQRASHSASYGCVCL